MSLDDPRLLEPALIVLACGVGTFLMRWLPVARALRHRRAARPGSRLARLSAALGPAALAALLVASVLPMIQRPADAVAGHGAMTSTSWLHLGSALVAAAVVIGSARLGAGIALRTVAGTLAWGACLAAGSVLLS